MPIGELHSRIFNMPLEKIRKIGGGLGSNKCLWIAGVVPAKLIDKKLISCVKYRKK